MTLEKRRIARGSQAVERRAKIRADLRREVIAALLLNNKKRIFSGIFSMQCLDTMMWMCEKT